MRREQSGREPGGVSRKAHSLRIGFIGVGRMGLPMCANLAQAGYDVVAGDVRADREGAVTACGARWGGTGVEVAAVADVLITVLPGTQELRDMMLAPGDVRRSCRRRLPGLI
jgi:3-hydroxyisobutyrate dehydrogenase-like beta-hydroxyacid dehydrogenase